MNTLFRLSILLCLCAFAASAQPALTIKRVSIASWPTVEAYYEVKCIGQLHITHTTANLAVEEDGLPVSAFSIAHPDTTQHHPMSVTLVFDAGGASGGAYNPAMKSAGSVFIDKMNGTTDEAALVFFNTLVTLQQPMTSQKATLQGQLALLGFAGNRAMLDGTHTGVLYTASGGQRPNKAVVVVTDGYDNASSHTAQELIDLARTYKVRIYTVGLGTSYDLNTLRSLADSTGGAFYNVPDTTQLRYVYSEIYEHISDEGRESRLTYTTSCQDGGTHEFGLAVTGICSGNAQRTTAFVKPNNPADRQFLDLVIGNTEALAGTFISVPVMNTSLATGILQPMVLGISFPKSVLQLQNVVIGGSSPLLNTTMSVIPVGDDYSLRTASAVVINGPGILFTLDFLVIDREDSVSCEIRRTGAMAYGGCLTPVLYDGRVNIGVAPRPVIEAVGPSGVCPGDSVVLRLTKTYDRYMWTTGDSTRVIAVRTGGNVGVAVMDRAGRTGLSSPFKVEVFDAPAPVLTVPDTVSLCSGNSLPLATTQPYAAYRWSTGDTAAALLIDSAGTFFVEVTDSNGCSGVSDTLVVILDDPIVSITANGPLTFCEGDTLWLRASGGFVTWRWNNGGPFQDLAVTASGRYSVRAVNAAGCIAFSDTVDAVMLPRPLAVITSDKSFTLCANDSLTLDAQDGYAQYLWSTGATSRRIVVHTPGSYWVKVAGASGCFSAADTVRIGTPVRPQLTPSGPQVACYGEPVRVDAGAGFLAYRWNTGDTTRIVDLRLSGDFWVDATEPGGCVVRSDTVFVQIRERIDPEITAAGSLTFCVGDSVILNAPLGYVSYHWNSGETSSRIVVRNTGDYRVTVFDNENCSGTSRDISVTVNPRPPKPVITRQDAELTAPSASSYQWYRDGLPVPGATQRRYTVQSNARYAIEVFNEYGCGAMSEEMTVIVVSVAALPDGFAVELYPDPTDGLLTVSFSPSPAAGTRMQVLNLLGQIVASQELRAGVGTSARHVFDLRRLPAGIYLLRIESGAEMRIRRFVLTR